MRRIYDQKRRDSDRLNLDELKLAYQPKHHQAPSWSGNIVIEYCMDLDGRHLLIKITDDGVVHWLDCSTLPPIHPVGPTAYEKELQETFLSTMLYEAFRNGKLRPTISVNLPTGVFSWIRITSIKFKTETETEKDIVQLADYLQSIFWNDVHPKLGIS